MPPALLDILVQTFADLRDAQASATSEEARLESALSTAEQIGVLEDAILHSQFFGDASLTPDALARSLMGTLVRRSPEDVSIMSQFWHAVVDKKKAKAWKAFAASGKNAMKTMK